MRAGLSIRLMIMMSVLGGRSFHTLFLSSCLATMIRFAFAFTKYLESQLAAVNIKERVSIISLHLAVLAFTLQFAGPVYSKSTRDQIDFCLGTVWTGPYGDTRAQELKSCILIALGMPRTISIDALREGGFTCSQKPARCRLITSTFDPSASFFGSSIKVDWFVDIELNQSGVGVNGLTLSYEREKLGTRFYATWKSDSSIP